MYNTTLLQINRKHFPKFFKRKKGSYEKDFRRDSGLPDGSLENEPISNNPEQSQKN